MKVVSFTIDMEASLQLRDFKIFEGVPTVEIFLFLLGVMSSQEESLLDLESDLIEMLLTEGWLITETELRL